MSDSYILLRNVRLVDPDTGKTDGCDIFAVRRDRGGSEILKIGRNVKTGDAPVLSVLNLHGGHACAPFTDLRCQIPDPGYSYRESLQSGLMAAGAGGYGRVLLMPTTRPLPDSKNLISTQRKNARNAGVCSVEIAVPLTKGAKGQAPVAYEELKSSGAAAVCADFEEKEPSAYFCAEAARICAELGLFYIAPCRKRSIHDRGDANKGKIASFLGVRGIDPLGELLALGEAITISEETGCPVHFPLVTLEKSVQAVARAKERGVKISCGTAAQYYALCENDLLLVGSYAKFDPPLRREEDRLAVIEGLRGGVIDCICSDHTPLSAFEKNDGVAAALPGAVGFETAFAAGLTHLVSPGHLPLASLVRLMSSAPARLLGKEAAVRVGGKLDLILFDPSKKWIPSSNALRSRSADTPFFSSELRGAVTSVFSDGVRCDY